MIGLSLVLNVAGAALFALVGIGILVVSRGERTALLVGATATTFGMTWVFENFLRSEFDFVARIGVVVFSILFILACVALALHLVRGVSRRARASVATVAVVLVVLWVSLQATRFALGAQASAFGWARALAYNAFLFALVLLTAATAVAFRAGGPARPTLACLGLAFAPFTTFLVAAFAASAGFDLVRIGTGVDLLLLALGGLTAVAVGPFAEGRRSADALSRAVFPATIVAGLAGLGLVLVSAPTFTEDFGAFGIIRTLGAFFLALGVLKYDLLGVPLSRIAVSRGPLAAAALASLFIVAQVAQNFLSDEYGLLIGGVVAGALLFAANPIQRAMERMASPEAGRPAPSSASASSAAAYRAAVRAALRDGTLTRREELHLAEVAEHLGLGAREAARLRHEVEDESEVRA